MSKSNAETGTTWKELTRRIIDRLPDDFTLADLSGFKPQLAASYPNNKHIDAKIRQTLQVLRDHGELRFLGEGHYVKLGRRHDFSPHLDFGQGAGFSSQAQVARVVLETWTELNLFCLNCDCDALLRLPPNTPVADFKCPVCGSTYQLKAKNGRFGRVIPGAAFEPTISAVHNGSNPDYLLLEYDTRFDTVVLGIAIRGESIDESRIIPRAPLGPSARRSGWVGCNIQIQGLPRALIIEPTIVSRSASRERWKTLRPSGGHRTVTKSRASSA